MGMHLGRLPMGLEQNSLHACKGEISCVQQWNTLCSTASLEVLSLVTYPYPRRAQASNTLLSACSTWAGKAWRCCAAQALQKRRLKNKEQAVHTSLLQVLHFAPSSRGRGSLVVNGSCLR